MEMGPREIFFRSNKRAGDPHSRHLPKVSQILVNDPEFGSTKCAMFTQAILSDAVLGIKLVSHLPLIQKSYLAGGTALALQLGHRVSEDLDFFTSEEFDEQQLLVELEGVGLVKESVAWRTIIGRINKTRFSIFYYKYPLLSETTEFEGIKLASKQDIAAMKIHAMEDRGVKRDFIDLFFLAKEFSIDQMLEYYDKKYGVLEERIFHIIKSMGYFDEADNDDWKPEMIKEVPWEQVKSFFEAEAKRLAQERLGIRG